MLPRIDREYEALVEKGRRGDVNEAIDRFFAVTSEIAVVGEGLREALASVYLRWRTKISKELCWKPNGSNQLLNMSRANSFKPIKRDPVKYAESVRQVVDVFGRNKSIYLLNTNGIMLKRSALASLCRVANETPKIKTFEFVMENSN